MNVTHLSDAQVNYSKCVSPGKVTSKSILTAVIGRDEQHSHPRSHMMLDGETMQHEFEGEFENEFENEYENEFEDEYESEHFGGSLLKGVGSSLGLGEGEYEGEYESEAFLKQVRKLASRFAPVLKQLAPHAARIVGTAVGGPGFGQAAGTIAGRLLREGEFEYEFSSEFEDEYELTGEFESEYEYEASPQQESLAEALAAAASQAESEAEAEAYIGASITRIMPLKSISMCRIAPNIVKGGAYLTRTLRKSRTTRPLVRTIPTIALRTSRTLAQQAAQGRQITPSVAARVMAGHTRKVLSSPTTTAKTLLNSAKVASKVSKAVPAREKVRN